MFWLNKHKLVYSLRWWSAVLKVSKKHVFFFSLKNDFGGKKTQVLNHSRLSKPSKVNFCKCVSALSQSPNTTYNLRNSSFATWRIDLTISGALRKVCALERRNIPQTLREPQDSHIQSTCKAGGGGGEGEGKTTKICTGNDP